MASPLDLYLISATITPHKIEAAIALVVVILIVVALFLILRRRGRTSS